MVGNRFTALLLAGVARDQARRKLTVDQLGDDPVSAVTESARRQAHACAVTPPRHPVAGPTGQHPRRCLPLRFRLVDRMVHAWDLRRAARLDETLDQLLVVDLMRVVERHLQEMLAYGAYGPGPSGTLPPDAFTADPVARPVRTTALAREHRRRSDGSIWTSVTISKSCAERRIVSVGVGVPWGLPSGRGRVAAPPGCSMRWSRTWGCCRSQSATVSAVRSPSTSNARCDSMSMTTMPYRCPRRSAKSSIRPTVRSRARCVSDREDRPSRVASPSWRSAQQRPASLAVRVQLIGAAWREDVCLAAADAIEAARGVTVPIDPRAQP